MNKLLKTKDLYLYKKVTIIEEKANNIVMETDLIEKEFEKIKKSGTNEEIHDLHEKIRVLSEESRDLKDKLQVLNYKICN